MTSASESADNGLGVFGPDELGLLRAFDGLVLSLAERLGAVEYRYPFLLRQADLDSVDYFENFPHLGLAVAAGDPARLATLRETTDGPLIALPSDVLGDARFTLPSAACYSVYFALRGQTLATEANRFTTVATCFRNETRYEGLRRLLGFSMREIVFVGTSDSAKDHLRRSKEFVLDLAGRLGLDMTVEVATDPFFDSSGSRAKLQRLFPVKEEFIVDGLAVGSVNYHRNFFGDRCSIRLPDGTPAHTSCLAFGLERWVHVLMTSLEDASSAIKAIWEVGQ